MLNLEGLDPDAFASDQLDSTDRWILSRLAATIADVTDAIESFKYSEPLNQLYRFFWNDLCDWYLEWAKPKMRDQKQRPSTQNVLAFVLDQTLRMLHPFLPFITEGIFQNLNRQAPLRGLQGLAEAPPSAALVTAQWPALIESLRNEEIEAQIELIQTCIRTVREIRSARSIAPSKKLTVSVSSTPDTVALLKANLPLVMQLAHLETLEAGIDLEKPANAAVAVAGPIEVYVHDAVDPAAERARLEKQAQQVGQNLKGIQAKLANENFVNRAKPEVVEQTRQKQAELQEQLASINRHLSELG